MSGAEHTVDVFVGTRGVEGSGKHTTRLVDAGIWRGDISDVERNANIFLASSGFIVVQLVSDDGQLVSAVTCFPHQ